jgi:hypothetical protein
MKRWMRAAVYLRDALAGMLLSAWLAAVYIVSMFVAR